MDMFSHQNGAEKGWFHELGTGVSRAREMCMLRDEFQSGWTRRLLRTLQFSSRRQASVPHDHIYGLRSLLPAKGQESIQPGYNLSIRELYTSITKLPLERKETISLLCCAIRTNQWNEHNLPSWSLDFSKPLGQLPAADGDDDVVVVIRYEFLRSEGSNVFDILRLKGENQQDPIAEHLPNGFGFGFAEVVDCPETSGILSRFVKKDVYKEDRNGRSYYESDKEANQQYVIFRTQGGRFGKCFNEVQQGDEIWTLLRSTLAFVLRPLPESELEEALLTRNRYRLVGACDFLDEDISPSKLSGHVTQSAQIV
jgi:hypothetical protein